MSRLRDSNQSHPNFTLPIGPTSSTELVVCSPVTASFPMTLLTLVSRQIWPQVIAVAAERPTAVVLLHTDNAAMSQRPAERLKHLLESQGLLRPGNVHLHLIPGTPITDCIEAIGAAAEAHSLGPENCRMHLTGGTKLLNMAAVEWCRICSNPSFYLDNPGGRQQIVPFHFESGHLVQGLPKPISPDTTNLIDPLALLKCQLDDEDVTEDGQTLTLSSKGQDTPLSSLPQLIDQERNRRGTGKPSLIERLLEMKGPTPEARAGDLLELATAFALLKSGPICVQRGVTHKSRNRSNSLNDSGELDLVFNWNGRLWIVDCKDRIDAEDRVESLRDELFSAGISSKADQLLKALAGELKDKELKTLKEDIAALADAGGLQGKALIVRREKLPSQAEDYARTRKLAVVLAERLHLDLPQHLAG